MTEHDNAPAGTGASQEDSGENSNDEISAELDAKPTNGCSPLDVGIAYLESGNPFRIELVTWMMGKGVDPADIGAVAQVCGVPLEHMRSVAKELPKDHEVKLVQAYYLAAASPTLVSRPVSDRALDVRLPSGIGLPKAIVVGGDGIVVDANGMALGKHGKELKPICNFVAVIDEDRFRDDGAQVDAEYGIDVYHCGVWQRVYVDAQDFLDLKWVHTLVGPTANIFPGCAQSVKSAIQGLSQHVHGGLVPRTTVYGHLGWRRLSDGQQVFLTAAGALGANGIVLDVEVGLPGDFSRYYLPAVEVDDDLRRSVRASLSIMDIGPDIVTVPVIGATYLPPLGDPNGSVLLSGLTGSQKTSVAALAQQHYGSEMDADHLPAAWSSTPNALEMMAFIAKDCLLVIDDFNPQGSQQELGASHAMADRVLRAVANSSGRSRLGKDSELQVTRPARCFVLATGEEVPKGQSLRGRVPNAEMERGDIDLDLLTLAQRDASAGVYAQSMAGYIRWLAASWDQVQLVRKERGARLRSELQDIRCHPFTATIVADLGVGFRFFLDYALDIEAVTPAQADALWGRAWAALREVLRRQQEGQSDANPVDKFIGYLRAAISAGHAHVSGFDGDVPSPMTGIAWGWKKRTRILWSGEIGEEEDEWQQQGERVAYVRHDDLYLDPDAAYGAAQAQARRVGETLVLSAQTLGKRLKERGLLMVEPSRDTNKTRVTITGQRLELWHVEASILGIGLRDHDPDPLEEEPSPRRDQHALPGNANPERQDDP